MKMLSQKVRRCYREEAGRFRNSRKRSGLNDQGPRTKDQGSTKHQNRAWLNLGHWGFLGHLSLVIGPLTTRPAERSSSGSGYRPGTHSRRCCLAFTMVEIAICIAVIGFALVAIVGVLPIGMQVQKDNREET